MTHNSAPGAVIAPLSERQIHERLAGLRRCTAPYHNQVEGVVDITARLRTRSGYADFLARLYGFYEPFEAELDRAVSRWQIPFDVEARRKAPLIARDLATLGRSPSAIQRLPRCARLPRPRSAAAALGCLYVTEGATLGGQIIARQARRELGFAGRQGVSFFHGYGPETGLRWGAFRSVLATACSSTDLDETILAGAVETFVAYRRWLEHRST